LRDASVPAPPRSGGLRWILVVATSVALSLAAGWFLPDGLNALARALHQPEVPTNGLTRFFCFALLFVISSATELLLWTRQQTSETLGRVDGTIRDQLAASATAATENAVLRAVLPAADATPEEASCSTALLKAFGSVLASVPSGLLVGYSVLIENGLANVDDDIHAAGTGGLRVNIRQHVEITRRLAQQASWFTQINRKAFHVPGEWTQEWLDLVDELGARTLSKEYIVLMPAAALSAQLDDIMGMREYLEQRRWTLKCCEVERVEDALGGALPTQANLDVYDGDIAKLQAPPSGEYRGGIELSMRLVELRRQPAIRSFVTAVRQFGQIPVGH
jgi:hypothetical protein